ncbi:protein-histidine kinase [Ceratobasidium sp. AG-Ba]|nr:protein-histidine kinase [Ceratobasidium sp. AG-Ba]
MTSGSLKPGRSTASNPSLSPATLDPSKLPSRMLDTFPWEQTSLGPRSEWPQSLSTLVQFVMAKPIPTTIYWGWPELVMIYNDSYAYLAGTKHPSIFGQRAAIAWGDLWEVVKPVAELCRKGKSTHKIDDPLFFTSHTEFGLPQEIYHTWHWTPVWKEDGAVTQESLTQTVLESLSRHETDLPFIALYSCSVSERAIGIPDNHPAAPETIGYNLDPSTLTESSDPSNLTTSPPSSPWPFPNVFSSGAIEIVNPIPDTLAKGLNSRAFGDTPNIAALVPIPKHQPNPGPSLPHAVLVVGLNTRRPYDADCEKWLLAIAAAFSGRLLAVEKIEADAEDMQERIRLDKAKTKFFMMVSHELRTPLTLVQAPIEQIAELQGLPTSVTRRTGLAIHNVKRLRKLVDTILDISKLEAGQLVGRFQPVQLDRLTTDMASLFQSMAEKRGIKLVLEVENQEGAMPPTYVDIGLWERIFWNLLSNAFKYTSKGKVTVSVTYDYTSAYLRVCDTGIGIPQGKQQDVFEHFQRLHDMPAEGTGIGLALAKLVHLHGGQLTVASRAESEFTSDTGSAFTVMIPLGTSHLPTGNVLDQSTPIPRITRDPDLQEIEYWMELEATTSSANSDDEIRSASSTLFFEPSDVILINGDMRNFIRSIFTPYLTTIGVENGVEALEVLANREVNLILSDVLMPKMGGVELMSKLREHQKTRFVPLIFVTAVADDVGLFDGREEGIVDCITKPFRARWVGIFRTDANGGVTYANPTWYQIIGHPKEQDKDEWLECISSDSHAPALKAWRKCFLENDSSSVNLKWRNGRWTHFNIAPLLTPEGAILGAFGTTTDITDLYKLEEAKVALAEERERSARVRAEEAELRRQAEEGRRRAQELLIDVTSHELRQPVSAILQNAEVARANMQSLKDILGRCYEDGVGYNPTSQTLEDLEDDLQALESIRQCGLSQARIAGDVLSLSRIQLNALSIYPTTFDVKQQVERILSIFRNELVSKSIFLSTNFSERTKHPALRIVSADRDRFGQIITNLMSNAIRFTEMSTRAREIKVAVDVALDPPSDHSCVPPENDPPVIQSYDHADVPVYVYVSIQDSGPGLQKEDLALLFQRHKSSQNAHHVFGGSGLGLFVCRQLCSLMGGRIEVENVSGDQASAAQSGAKFQFFIRASRTAAPIEQNIESTATPEPQQTRASRVLPGESWRSASGKPLHVLITEDNKINQDKHRRQMKRAGFTAVLASNGAEAVEAVSNASRDSSCTGFDVILMDLEMPVMDGFSATREIRQLEKAGRFKYHNFIIAVTGNARPEQVRAAQEAGVNEVIIKPYNLYKLIATMIAGP